MIDALNHCATATAMLEIVGSFVGKCQEILNCLFLVQCHEMSGKLRRMSRNIGFSLFGENHSYPDNFRQIPYAGNFAKYRGSFVCDGPRIVR